jgi:hypothetical protein
VSTWHLIFQSDSPVGIDVLAAALEAAIRSPLTLQPEAWSGNPRDGYGRWVCGEGRAGEVTLRARLDLQMAYTPDSPPDSDTARVSVDLSGGAPLARQRLWGRIATALAEVGYADQTLAGSPASIVDDLEAAGEVSQAAALRSAITEALIAAEPMRPEHWPVQVSFSRPDDLDRVLRAVRQPQRVRTLSLIGCALTALPAVLLEEPARFSALEQLNLSYNRLIAVPLLVARYPALRWLDVSDNPMAPLRKADWPGVTLRQDRPAPTA